jgi:hypothetical protein
MGTPVKYGAQVLLKHSATGVFLKSVPKVYTHPKSSGQQIVGGEGVADDYCVWLVKGPHATGNNFPIGKEVRHGDRIRLEHVRTGRNLHSHSAPSPLTSQQEVTAYGAAGNGDSNDDWVVDLGAHGTWELGSSVCLLWCTTNFALHSHKGYSSPVYTDGLQEVTSNIKSDANDIWVCVEEGETERAQPVQRATRLDWISILSIVGSIASVTGWTLITLKETLQEKGFIAVTALALSIGFTSSCFLILSGIVLGLYRKFTFNPKTVPSRLGFWVFVCTMVLVGILFAWRMCLILLGPTGAFVRWGLGGG